MGKTSIIIFPIPSFRSHPILTLSLSTSPIYKNAKRKNKNVVRQSTCDKLTDHNVMPSVNFCQGRVFVRDISDTALRLLVFFPLLYKLNGFLPLVRAASHAKGHWFKSGIAYHGGLRTIKNFKPSKRSQTEYSVKICLLSFKAYKEYNIVTS